MMKKLLTACLSLCLLLCAASALAEDMIPVQLGDGAPIAYFDGFTSDAVTDPSALAGVTGAVDAGIYMDYAKSGMSSIYELVNHTIQLQNMAVTDDYIALFLRLDYDKEIPFPEGRMQYHINKLVMFLPVMQGTEYVGTNPIVEEGHLLDDKTLAYMMVYPLDQPLDLTQPLSIYTEWTETGDPAGGLHFMVDTSMRNDPATVVTPGLELLTNPANKNSVSTSTITRIACTPFGLRIALEVKDDGLTYGFGYAVLDGEGRYLPQMREMWTSHTLASAEHPQIMYNDLWLLESGVPDSLQLVPIERQEDGTPQEFTHYVPFDSIPTDVTLDSGTVVHIAGVDVEADGYLMHYSLSEWNDFGLDIDLARADGERLGLNVVSINMPSLRTGTLGYGGYWSEEYKGELVARVTPEQIAEAAGVLFHGWEYGSKLLMDQAVLVDIQ